MQSFCWLCCSVVNGPVSPVTSTSVRTWVNVETNQTIAPVALGDTTTFVWSDWPGSLAGDDLSSRYAVPMVVKSEEDCD